MSSGTMRRCRRPALRGVQFFGLLILACAITVVPLRSAAVPIPPIKPVPFGDSVVRPLPPELTLSQVRAAQIIQDDRGFLWIGTQYGLNRYDGFRVRQFVHDPADASSLGGTYIQVLFKDSKGNLWISTDQAFDRYDPETDTFRHFDLRSGKGGARLYIRHICEDSLGTLWLGTGEGLVQFNPNTGAYKPVNTDKNGEPLFADSDIKGLNIDRAGRFWIATRKDIDLFDPATQKIVRRIPTVYSPAVTLIHEDIHGNLWVIVENNLYKVDGSLTRLEPIHSLGGVDLTSFGQLRTMTEDRDGDLWFGTEYSGIIHFKQAQQAIETFSHQPGRSDSLPSNRITAIFQDQRGDIWVGFHDTAPCLILRGALQFRSTAYLPDSETGLSSPLVTTVFEETPNDVLIGTSGVLQRQSQTTGDLTRAFPFLDGTDVLSIYCDVEGRMWFGTDKGLYRVDRHGGRKQFGWLHNQGPHLSGAHVERIFSDKKGRLWVITWNGVDLYDPVSDSFNTVLELDNENIYAVAEDTDGSFWFGTNRGVKHFAPEDKTLIAFPYKGGSIQGPSDTRVNALFVDSTHTLWVGTQSGLDRFNRSTKTFQRVADGNGLGGQVVSCIEEDAGQHLWLSTNQGVLRYTPSSSSFEQFTTIDGLPGMDLTGWGACTRGASNRIYFGGFSGLVSFNPDITHHSDFVPKIVLTNLLFDGVPLKVGKTKSLPRAISYLRGLSLPYDRNSFSFEFASLDFRDARVERFRYKLEGLDSTWTAIAPGQHSVSFAHLPWRHYLFHLQICGGGEDLWKDGISFPIDIAPAWWARWWMIAFYSLAVLCVLAWEWNRRLWQVRALYEARLEGRVRERTRLARDLHDTLLQDIQGLILRFQSYLLQMKDDDSGRQTLTTILNSAEESVVQSRDAIHSMRTIPVDLRQLVDAFGEYAEEIGFLSDAEVILQKNTNSFEDCELDTGEVFRIGKEAIRNALQHSQATKIWIRITCRENAFELAVEDDGVGISPDVVVNGRPGHWGIRGMYERAARAGFTLTIRSRYSSARGTEVMLLVPLSPKNVNRVSKALRWLRARHSE